MQCDKKMFPSAAHCSLFCVLVCKCVVRLRQRTYHTTNNNINYNMYHHACNRKLNIYSEMVFLRFGVL